MRAFIATCDLLRSCPRSWRCLKNTVGVFMQQPSTRAPVLSSRDFAIDMTVGTAAQSCDVFSKCTPIFSRPGTRGPIHSETVEDGLQHRQGIYPQSWALKSVERAYCWSIISRLPMEALEQSMVTSRSWQKWQKPRHWPLSKMALEYFQVR